MKQALAEGTFFMKSPVSKYISYSDFGSWSIWKNMDHKGLGVTRTLVVRPLLFFLTFGSKYKNKRD